MNDDARLWLARSAVDSAAFIEGQGRQVHWLDLTEAEIAYINGLIAHHQAAIADVEKLLPDADLLDAYRRASSRPGNRRGGALLAEIERRRLRIR